MSKLITQIKRVALALCFATPLVSRAAMEFTDPTYTPWDGVYGAVAWRSDGGNFEVSKVADIAADGTIGEPYAMKWDTAVATTGRRFCSACTSSSSYPGYTPPGMLLVYDQTGKTAAANATFNPLSFCGLWVKALADETTPYSVTGSGTRATEFGVAGVSSYFKFDKSFTVNRTGTTTFLGDATVEIAQDATFTAQANSSHVVAVDSAATLKLKGAGALAVTTMDVNGTLDLSEATRPTIAGNVNLYGTIVLPEGTEVSTESPFTVCTGTLSGLNVLVKIGDAEAVEKSFTAVNGAITAFADPIYVFTENYPTIVPAGKTYTFVGGDSAENTVVVDALDVRGTLKTQGYFSFTNYKSNGSTLDVETGSLTLNPGNNWFNGTLTVEAGATFVNALETDAVQYGGTFTANIYGTLDMGATRWSLGSNNTLNFYEGCTVTGSGQGGNGTFDWIENATATMNVYGDVSLAAPIRVRSTATVNVNVDTTDQKGLTLANTIGAGKLVKKGAGLVKFTTNPPYAITVESGAFTFAVDATPTITYSAKPGAGTAMSMWYATQATWKGTVVIGTLSAPAALPLDAYGNENSKIVLTGTTGNCYLNGTTTVAAELVVGTDENSVVEFNNGNSDQVGTFSKVSGPGTLKLVGWTGCRAATYVLSTLDNFEGLAIANNITRDGGGTFTVRIGNIVTTRTTNPGDCVLPIANTALDNATGTVVYDLTNAQVNGNTLDLEAKDDGIYVVVPTVTVTIPDIPNTTVVVTADGEPVTGDNGSYVVPEGSEVVATYTAVEGYELSGTAVYTIDSATDGASVTPTCETAQYIAKIDGGSSYTSLQAAIDATAQTNSKIVLLANEEDGATVPSVNGKSFFIYAGEFTHGTIADAVGDFVTTVTDAEITIDEVEVSAKKYRVVAAVAVVTIPNESATKYGDYMMAYNAFLAGPVGTTMRVIGENPFSTEIPCTTYDSETQTYTKLAAVASITVGQITTNYPSLADAIEAAEAGQTVKLLAGISATSMQVVDKEVTLDLNGFAITEGTWTDAAITAKDDAILCVVHGGSLTVNDSSDGKTGAITAGGVKATSAIKMTKIGDTDDTNKAILVVNAGTLTGYYYAVSGNGSTGRGNTEVTINGGTLRGTCVDDSVAIFNPQAGTLTIAGGYLEGAMGVYVKSGTATVTVTAGTIKGVGTKTAYKASKNGFYNTGDAFVVDNVGYPGGAPAPSILGGTLVSVNASAIASYSAYGNARITKFAAASLKTSGITEAVASSADVFDDYVDEVPVTPGSQTEPVDTEAEAEAEAAKVVPSVPAAVAEELTPAQEAAYTEMFEAKVVQVTVGETTKYAVEVVMKDSVAADIQTAVDAEAGDFAEAAAEAAADAVNGGSATVSTVAGLYYVVEAGTEVDGIAPASCTLATGDTLDLTLPNKGEKGFYKLRVSVTPVAVQ